MSDGLTVFGKAGLPSVDALASALRNVQNEVSGGVCILKMDKVGVWSYGVEAEEPEPNAEWAVNPFSFTHGYIAWGERVVLGEHMTPLTDPMPELDEAPAGAKKGWEQQLGFMLRCMTGKDEGVECRYSTTSEGGKRAILQLTKEIAERIVKDPSHPVPLVTIGSETYAHPKYSKVWVPTFSIVGWTTMDGDRKEAPLLEAAEEVDAVTTEQPERRRRRV